MHWSPDRWELWFSSAENVLGSDLLVGIFRKSGVSTIRWSLARVWKIYHGKNASMKCSTKLRHMTNRDVPTRVNYKEAINQHQTRQKKLMMSSRVDESLSETSPTSHAAPGKRKGVFSHGMEETKVEKPLPQTPPQVLVIFATWWRERSIYGLSVAKDFFVLYSLVPRQVGCLQCFTFDQCFPDVLLCFYRGVVAHDTACRTIFFWQFCGLVWGSGPDDEAESGTHCRSCFQ